jgi:eukaryotic-like serine/threonine-protein kinase
MSESVFGKYRLIVELGQGGMADVFLAATEGPLGSGFSKLSVIKRLRRSLAEDPDFVTMLVDEARIAARLNHPNVVQTNEVGEVNGEYFIAMEYLDGQPFHRIQRRLKQSTTMLPAMVEQVQLLVLAETLAGLHYSHELSDYDGTPLKIVHRDVTPQNIFVTYTGQVKVVDFGIAKAQGRNSETQQGVVKGKVRYMSPEQLTNRNIDCRADLFSVGIMVWEILTRKRFWSTLEDLQVGQSLITGQWEPSPKLVLPSVPDALDAICCKALARDLKDRYANADEMRSDIEQYLASAGTLLDIRRQLGPILSKQFEDKREELRLVIERQLSAQATLPPSQLRPATLPVSSISQAIGSRTPSSHSASSLVHSTFTNAETTAAPVSSSSRAKWGIGAVAVMALGAVVAVVSGIGTKNASQNVPAVVTTVAISLRAQPSNASFSIDAEPVGSAFVRSVAKDAKPHTVSVSAPGYVTLNEELRFDADLTKTFELVMAPVTVNTLSRPAPTTTAGTGRRWGSPAPKANPAQTSTSSSVAGPLETAAVVTPAATATGRPKKNIDTGNPWDTPPK